MSESLVVDYVTPADIENTLRNGFEKEPISSAISDLDIVDESGGCGAKYKLLIVSEVRFDQLAA